METACRPIGSLQEGHFSPWRWRQDVSPTTSTCRYTYYMDAGL
jgi:hypothetical protein